MKKRNNKIFDQLKSDLMQIFNYNIIMYEKQCRFLKSSAST